MDFRELLRRAKADFRTEKARKRGKQKIKTEDAKNSAQPPPTATKSTPPREPPRVVDSCDSKNQPVFKDATRCLCPKSHLVSESGAWYLPEWITEEDEARLLERIRAPAQSLSEKAPSKSTQWVRLRKRRLQCWGGDPEGSGIRKRELPSWLRAVCRRVQASGAFSDKLGDRIGPDVKQGGSLGPEPNHVLINEYKPGQGIMAHQDGPLYAPRVAIVSLGSSSSFHFYDSLAHARDGVPIVRLILEPRSLLVFGEHAYKGWWHEVPEGTQDRATGKEANIDALSLAWKKDREMPRRTRLSLTVRHVPESSVIR